MEAFRNRALELEYFTTYDEQVEKFPVEFKSIYVDTQWCKTHVMRCGKTNGKKLVVLHCMGFSSLCWYGNIEAWAEKYDVYLIDTVGEPNRTENYTNRINFDNYMNWLNDTITGLKLNKIMLAGWSFGGFLAVGYTICHPEKVEKTLAFSPAGTISKLSNVFMLKLFPALIIGKVKYINKFLKWISGNDNNDYPNPGFSIFTKGMQSFNGWARGTSIKVYSDRDFESLKIPCKIIIGDKDPIYNNKIKKNIKRLNILNNTLNIEFIKGTHGFPIQRAGETTKILLDYFDWPKSLKNTISHNMFIFIWDPLEAQPHDPDVKALLRIATVYDISIANNLATADFIIHPWFMSEEYVHPIEDYNKQIKNRVNTY